MTDELLRDRVAGLQFDYEAQEKEWISACNLCGSDRWTKITHRDRYGFRASSTFCNECSLTMLNPRMTAQAYSAFYRDTYRPLVSAFHDRLIDAMSVQEEQAKYSVEIESMLLQLFPDRSWTSLLDIGGSTGVIAAHLAQRFDLQATVIDPAPDELSEAKRLGVKTVTGFVEDWVPPANDRFDLVGMFQTVDHLLDVRTALTKVRALLEDEGLFLMDIVDFRAAYLRGWSVEGATKIDHPYYLTESTTEAYLATTGFDVLHKSFSEDHLHVFYVCGPGHAHDDSLPHSDIVEGHLHEIRYVQNAPRPG